MNDQELTIAINAKDNASAVIKKAQDGVSKAVSNMADNFEAGMRKVSLASGAIAAGLTAYAKKSTDFVTQMASESKSLARETGQTQEQASQLLAVLNKLGVSAEQASGMFGIFSKQITDSRDKTSQAAQKQAELNNQIAAAQIEIRKDTAEITKNGDATGELRNKIEGLQLKIKGYQTDLKATANPLDELNVKTIAADGSTRSFNDILLDVADRFKALPDGTEKTTLALQLFGRSGKDMIKTLNQGSQGIKDLEANAAKLGLTLTQKNIGAINEYIASQKELKETNDSIKISVGTLTAPVLAAFNRRLSETAQKLLGVDAPTRSLTANVLAFGGPVATAAAAVAAFLGNLGSAGPILASVIGFLANPIFLVFAAAVGIITAKVLRVHQALGSWSAVLKLLQVDARAFAGTVMNLATQVGAYLEPKVVALWHTIEQGLFPVLIRLWREVVEPLIPVLGLVLVAAIRAVIDGLNLFLNVVVPVTNWMLDNKAVTLALAVAFGILATSMGIGPVAAAFNAAMAGVRATIATTQATTAALNGALVGFTGWAVFAAAAVAASIEVVKALDSIKGAWNDVNNAAAAAASNNDAQIIGLQKQAVAARALGDTKKVTQIANAISALEGGGRARAAGGSVEGGQAYVVGDGGRPELFVPNTSGRVEPSAPGGQQVTNILSGTFNFSSKDSVEAFFNRLDKTQRLARLGMA